MSTIDEFKSGISSALTWDNIGLQLANGAISKLGGLAVEALLGELFGQKKDIEELLENFADDIVDRLTAEIKKAISTAFYYDNMTKLKSSASSLARKFEIYSHTGDLALLDNSLNHSFDALEHARSLGIPALGSFATTANLKILILQEKAKQNVKFENSVRTEAERASRDCESLLDDIYHANQQAVPWWQTHTMDTKGEPIGMVLRFEGQEYFAHFNDEKRQRRITQTLVSELNERANTRVINPAKAIVTKWRELTV